MATVARAVLGWHTTIMAEKNITLDDLAVIVKKGFDEVYERMDVRFDHVENRLNSVESRLGRLEKDIAAIRFTLTQLAYRDEVNKLEERLTRIEKHLGLTSPAVK